MWAFLVYVVGEANHQPASKIARQRLLMICMFPWQHKSLMVRLSQSQLETWLCYKLICLVFYNIYTCSCSLTSKQKLQKAVAEIGNWDTMCEHLRVHKAVLNGLDNIIDSAGTLKKSRCLEAYLNMSTACILYAPDCTLLCFHKH